MPVVIQPLFDGLNIFGVVRSLTTEDPELAVQTNAYPGVDGVERVVMGARGRVTTIEGYLVGLDLDLLAGAKEAIRAYRLDGGAYTLLDTDGLLWTDVVLETFRPDGQHKVVIAPFYGWGCTYRVTLRHLRP